MGIGGFRRPGIQSLHRPLEDELIANATTPEKSNTTRAAKQATIKRLPHRRRYIKLPWYIERPAAYNKVRTRTTA